MKLRLRAVLVTAAVVEIMCSLGAPAQELARPVPSPNTEIIPINFASASELAAVLNSSGAGNDPAGARRLIERLQKTTDADELRTQIQSLGPRKITFDERTNSLLVTASEADLARIRGIIAKLDVALAQVLIEAVVLELPAPESWSIRRSHAADPLPSLKALTNAASVATAWYISNVTLTGPPLRKDLLALEATLAGNLDSVVWALGGVPGIRILQRPRIQTSVGVPATTFLGLGPSLYPTNGAYYGAAYCGCHAAIQMLHTGVTLEVTCFLAHDGTVLMDVRQQIDKLAGTVTIQNVGDVPVTTNCTAQVHVAVRDRDILVLGGFVENSREPIFSPVSFLDRVPVAGDWLNKIIAYPTRKTSRELVVLLRPVLLPPAQVTSSL